MNKGIIKLSLCYDYMRYKNYRLDIQKLNKKDFLWTKKKNTPPGISSANLMLTDENLFINIPIPLKKYRY